MLPGGSVLFAGGLDDTTCCGLIPPQASLEGYVIGSGSTGVSSMIASRYQHTTSLLANGKVLLAGTFGWSFTGSRSAELYDSAAAVGLANASSPDGNANVATRASR